MSRLETTFQSNRTHHQAAFISYLMAGDPDFEGSLQMARACIEGGADVLEIGMPFSDPIADGRTIQLASQRALAGGTTVRTCLDLAAAVRKRSEIPIVLMGSYNPVMSFGPTVFLAACQQSGVDGTILPDLPPEEATEWCKLSAAHNVKTVFLLAPTSTASRRQAVFAATTGFVYVISVTGVTGARSALPPDLVGRLESIRQASPVPVVVGFGISEPSQASLLAAHADGLVVGSAIVSRIAEEVPLEARARTVVEYVRLMKMACSLKVR